ncbi:MAG: acetyltransferase [Acidimicrobiia bacterium]|nr:acetyltransferase [Acidimicrobiia bacterium]MDH5421891.1 acetyltransferase [Acidimicrobiia bacterium]MDH5503676.1 acetyltransferase [Acidimicrobiia bacterium]
MSGSTSTSLLIGGAGGFARETIELAHAISDAGTPLSIVGVLDDDPGLQNTTIHGVSVLGGFEEIEHHPGASLVLTIGNPRRYAIRQEIVDRLQLTGERYATLIHPTTSIGRSVSIGSGTVIQAHAVATSDVRIGQHVVVMPGVVLTHDNVVEDFSTIASGTMVGGGVQIGRGAYIGAGAVIREGVLIGERAMIGMGSVVTKDVPAGETWFGVPAARRQ